MKTQNADIKLIKTKVNSKQNTKAHSKSKKKVQTC